MAATMKDIARLTGLSLATISKYLNGGHVLTANRQAIEDAISSLGYTVNTVARSLKTNKSMTIGVLIPALEQVFSTSIITSLENRLQRKGYSVLVCDYQQQPELEREKLAFLVRRQIDALVIMPLALSRFDLQEIVGSQITTVLIDRPIEGANGDVVLVDNYAAGYDAAQRLIRVGHRRIGILCGPQGIYTADERLQGFLAAFKQHQIKPEPDLIVHGDYDSESAYKLTRQLLLTKKPPTALFATNHETSFGMVMAVNELGIAVPEQLSLIGFDHQLLNQVMRPKLAIMAQPLSDIGREVADLLLKRLNDSGTKTQPQIRCLKAHWMDGQSYASVKTEHE